MNTPPTAVAQDVIGARVRVRRWRAVCRNVARRAAAGAHGAGRQGRKMGVWALPALPGKSMNTISDEFNAFGQTFGRAVSMFLRGLNGRPVITLC